MAESPKDYPLFEYITYKEAIMIVCFVGGFMDAVGYICLHGIFTASITGNIVNAVIPIYKNEKGFLPRFAVWIAIATGAWMTTSFSMKIRFVTLLNKWQVGMFLFGCEIVALLFAMSIGAALNYPDIDSWQTILVGIMMAFSMGVQNGAAMVMIPNCPPTTAMTGNTVRMGIYAAEAFDFFLASQEYIQLYPAKAGKPEDYDIAMRKNSEEMFTKFMGSFSAISSFAVGCMVGAAFAYNVGLGGIFFPIVVIAGLVLNIYVAGKKATADMEKNGTNVVEIETVESPIYKQMLGGTFPLPDGEGTTETDGETEPPRRYAQISMEATYDGGAHQTPDYKKANNYSVFTDADDAAAILSLPDKQTDVAGGVPFTLKNLSKTANEEVYRL